MIMIAQKEERNRLPKEIQTAFMFYGFRRVTLGWSDGHPFLPIDFFLLSSIKSQMNGISKAIDKRISRYKQRAEALKRAPELIPLMIDRALAIGMTACYVLMDS